MANQSAINSAVPIPPTKGGTGLSSTTINQLLYSSSNNVIAGLATANSAMLVTNSSGVPSMTATMTNGQVVIGSTGGTPAAASLTAGTNVTITPGANTITIAASGGGTGVAAYVRCDTASNITQSSGVSGVSVTAGGAVCDVTFSSAFSGATYISTMDIEYTPGGSAGSTRLMNSTSKASTTVYQTTSLSCSGFGAAAPAYFNFAFYGT